MNRIEFMDRLTGLLSDLPESERTEALQYYNDYLDDAGVENEQEVLEALGTPEQLAATIQEGLNEENSAQGEFSERGFQKMPGGSDEIIVKEIGGGSEQQSDGTDGQNAKQKSVEDFYGRYRSGNVDKDASRTRERKNWSGMSAGAWILIVICAICAAPILLPVAVALLVVFLVVAVTVVAVTLALLFSGIICIAAGLWALVTAIVKLFVVPAGALIAIGISLIVIGIGILLVLGMGWLLGRFLPKAFRSCVKLCSRLLNRKGGRKV